MQRILIFLACAGALALSACTGETALPDPTGKGAIRAINAIPGSPTVTFRIEERSFDTLSYKTASSSASYDDFEYNFNFDIDVPGESDPRRVATVTTQIEADRDHIFVLTGTLDNPTVLTWITDIREWGETETVFEQRFAHLSQSLGDIDIYFQDPAEPLVAGGHVARLAFGEVMDFSEFAEGEYTATVTAAGDLNTVHFVTAPITYTARASNTVSLFDGDGNDNGPFVMSLTSGAGQALRFTDPAYPATVRFVNGAVTLGSVDVYSDEALTELVVAGVELTVPTADLDTELAERIYYFTPAGSVATTLFSTTVPAPPPSTPTELFLIGDTDDWSGLTTTFDRASTTTAAKISLYHAAVNNPQFETFILERDAELTEDIFPSIPSLGFGFPSTTATRTAGSYDVYITAAGTRDIIGGPYPLDVALGDVVLLLAIDDPLDPAVVVLQDFSP
jgi:hypothetical protein